jgi:hypothetical protein
MKSIFKIKLQKNFIIFTIILLFSPVISGQIDSTLFFELKAMRDEDQKWRNLSTEVRNKQIDTLSSDIISKNIGITDSLNHIKLRDMVLMYGFLGFDKVGKVGSHNFWLLMQHQDSHPDFQEKVLALMEKELEKNNASANNYAYLLDRVRVNTGRLQVYGTQMQLNIDSTSYEPKPVEHPNRLDERRLKVGLPPIAKYIEIMNSRYFGDLNKN